MSAIEAGRTATKLDLAECLVAIGSVHSTSTLENRDFWYGKRLFDDRPRVLHIFCTHVALLILYMVYFLLWRCYNSDLTSVKCFFLIILVRPADRAPSSMGRETLNLLS